MCSRDVTSPQQGCLLGVRGFEGLGFGFGLSGLGIRVGGFCGGGFMGPQRAQYPLINEYSLNNNMNPLII